MKTILLVDDDQSVRTLYSLVLRRNGYRVIEADSGGAALDTARKHLPDLILCDIVMPGRDGVSLLRQIRRDPELMFRQFVLMSGSPALVRPQEGMEQADDFLVKPFGLQVLLDCMKARLNSASSPNCASERARGIFTAASYPATTRSQAAIRHTK
jgi:CheY-like chemotaxis protein